MKSTLTKIVCSLVLSLSHAAMSADNIWVGVRSGDWEPSREMLSELKSPIERYVRQEARTQGRELKNWSEYTFQYQGRIEKGKLFIFVNALCAAGRYKWDLDREIILVKDGGACYFNLKYDPKKKRILRPSNQR